MAEKEQLEILLQVLRQFHSAGVLRDIMLIGSWCLYFYRHEFKNPKTIPAVRTLDADFLIPNQRKLEAELDVPLVLRKLGFAPTFNRSNGLVVYDHPQLRIEFLIPEIGKGFDKPQDIKKLHVNAQGLRYLNFLADYPQLIIYEDIQVKVPEPAVFAVHKLIISQRRTKEDKRERDLEAAAGILDWIFDHPEELKKLKQILETLPRRWKENIVAISDRNYPRIAAEIKNL